MSKMCRDLDSVGAAVPTDFEESLSSTLNFHMFLLYTQKLFHFRFILVLCLSYELEYVEEECWTGVLDLLGRMNVRTDTVLYIYKY